MGCIRGRISCVRKVERLTVASVQGCKARHGLPLVLHGLEEHILGPRPDQALFRFVYHHDDVGVGVGLQLRLADDLVDAALVVPVFHCLFSSHLFIGGAFVLALLCPIETRTIESASYKLPSLAVRDFIFHVGKEFL